MSKSISLKACASISSIARPIFCAGLIATAPVIAHASPFTTTVPGTADRIPGNYPEAGGIVLVLLGDNGNYYFQISNPSTMMQGYQDRNTTTPQSFRGSPTWQLAPQYNMQCGLVTCTEYFGGGVQAGWARFTAQDGDTAAAGAGNNFDVDDITLNLNGTTIGNWSDPATQRTNTAGTTVISSGQGFGDGRFDTGWFPINNASLLNDLMVNGSVTWTATDADPNDNFWDFTIGSDADTSVVPERVAPGMTVTKTPREGSYTNVGDTVTYDYFIRNVGTVYIDLINVNDDQIGTVTCPATRLDPGQDMTCVATDTITQDDLDAGSLTNNVVVSGTPQAGSLGPVNTSATVPATAQTSSMNVVKSNTSGTGPFQLGSVINYSVTMTNTGTVSQTNVVVSDNKTTPSNFSCARVLPGSTCVLNGSYTVTQADVDAGVVSNTGQAVSTAIPIPVTDTVSTQVEQTPALSVAKTALTTDFNMAGDILNYRYVVTNSGTVTIASPITVSDDRIASVSCPGIPSGGLAPSAFITCTASYTVTQADIEAGSVTNIATATDGTIVSPPATETVSGTQVRALGFAKTPTVTNYAAVGDTLSYEYVVTNVGNITVVDPISVTDDKIAFVNCPALPAGGLGPMQSLTCTANYSVTQADVDAGSVTNIASATDGTTVSPAIDATVTGTQTPAISLTKTATTASYAAVGDTISYDYVVTNSGNTTIRTTISIVDDKIATVACPALPGGRLGPNATLICTGVYEVTQTDIDAGSVTNLATATDGNVTSAQVSETVDATQTPELRVTKTANASGLSSPPVPGDIIVYAIRAENTGNVSLTSVTVTDTKIGGDVTSQCSFPGTTDTLSVGQTATCVVNYAITQADIDAGGVENSAIASGRDPANTVVSDVSDAGDEATETPGQNGNTDGNPTNDPTVTAITRASKFTVAKSATSFTFELPGDQAFYSYVVTNTGNTTLSQSITINDNLIPAADISCPAMPASGIAPGGTYTCTGEYTVTQADLDAGSVTNIASATDGVTTSPAASATIPANQSPSLTIEKTSTASDFTAVGDVLTYQFEIWNTGNLTLTGDTEVIDDRIGTFVCFSGNLTPGTSTVCSRPYTVTLADMDAGFVTNQAYARNGTLVSAPVDLTIGGTQSPSLSMAKNSLNTSFTTPGQTLAYDYTVVNTGNVTVSGLSVTDNKIATVSCPVATLAPGAQTVCSASYTVVQADVDAGFVTNNASVTGSPAGGALVPATDSETVNANQTPSLFFEKTAQTASFTSVGDALNYQYTVRNTGNVTVSAIVVTDDRIASISCPRTQLNPAQQMICSATDTVTQTDLDAGSVTNIGQVAGTPSGGSLAPVSDVQTVNANQTRSLRLEKRALDLTFAMAGDVLSYAYDVQNTGNVTLNQAISVTDDKIASIACPALGAGGFLPGQVITCTGDYVVTQADLDAGGVTNMATAASGAVVSPTDSATVTATQTPGLMVAKTSDVSSISAAGDLVSYTYVVTNSGNTTITQPISVSDDRITSVSCPSLPVGGLAPGNSLTCGAQYRATQADIDNGGVTNLAIADDGTTASPVASATVTATHTPALRMTKTAQNPVFDAVGDVINYTYVVTNSGNVTITAGVTVTDDKIASVSCPALPAGGLEPSETLTCSAIYVITQADLDAGSVTNIASASDGTTTSAPVSETATADQMPSMNVEKRPVDVVFTAPGDVSTYEYEVTNTGNTTITQPITVTDNLIASVNCPALGANGLAPNESILCTASYVVTQQDLDNGSVTNLASGTDGTTISPLASATIPVVAAPAIRISKAPLDSSYAMPGDVLDYRFSILNSGNLTLTGDTNITDDKIGTFTCFSGNIAPGTTETCTRSYTVTQADIDRGFVTNQAFGSNANQATTSPVVEATVNATQASQLTMVKTALKTAFSAPGDTIDYSYEVTNSGNTTIEFPISVADDRIDTVTCPALPVGGLAPNTSLTCTGTDIVTQADIDAGSVTNRATASDGQITSDPVSETVFADLTPGILIEKTALTADYAADGARLEYRYVVTNTGNTTLQGAIAMTDDRIGSVSCPSVPAAGLSPNGQVICRAFDITTQADVDMGSVTNTASATLDGATSPAVSVTIDAARMPGLTLVKTSDPSTLSDPVVEGDTLTYNFIVRNTGNVTLSDVAVRDPRLGGDITNTCTFPGAAGALSVNQTATCSAVYSVTQADIDAGGIENSATASGTGPSGAVATDASDAGNEGVETPGLNGTTDGNPGNDPTVTSFGPAPALSIAKSAVDTSFAAVGDVVNYNYTVSNTGNITLTTPVSVIDDKIASVTCPALPAVGLAPKASLECSAAYAITQSDIDMGSVTNIAYAQTGSGADLTISPSDTVTVDAALAPSFSFTKILAEPRQIAGPIFEATYTLRVANTGNTTLTGLVLEDDLATALAPATLVADPSVTLSGFSGVAQVNGNYDGDSDPRLATGDLSLPVGQTGIVTIRTRVDITSGSPAGGNTARIRSTQTPIQVGSDDPTVTPGNASDTNPTPFGPVDTDGDGAPDGRESATADRDGDGVPDSEDYDPTGYFYCEENGQILSGGGISVSGPAGANDQIGTRNNITIVQDGSNGFFQFYATVPGRYTITPTYPESGVPSTDRLPEAGALDVSTRLPEDPVILGASEVGATGRLADFSAAANGPFYTSFDIEAGDPAVFMNNLPLKSCGIPALALEKTVVGEAQRQDDGRVLVNYVLTATNTGQTVLNNVQLEDNLADVYGEGAVTAATVDMVSAPDAFNKSVNAAFDGVTSTLILADGEATSAIASSEDGTLLPGEQVSVSMNVLITANESGEFVNTATATAMPPFSANPAQGPNAGAALSVEDSAEVTIAAITDPSQLAVTKTARPSIVQIGDTIRYQITVANESDSTMTDLRIVDTPPAGFSYVPGSASLSKDDGSVIVLDPVVAPGSMSWSLTSDTEAPFDTLASGEAIRLNLSMVGGSSAEFGQLVNRAYVEDSVTGVRSLVATAAVEYLPEPTFDCTPVIGHVFDDVNQNGYQDQGEPGLPGVRLATVNGDLIVTDEHGRYHIPCASIPNNERGSNLLLKVDARTLPLGYSMTTENPRVVRATRGKFVKMNFGAAFSDMLRLEVSAADFDEANTLRLDALTRLSVGDTDGRNLVIYRADDGETLASVRQRMSLIRFALKGVYRDLTIEASMITEDETLYTGLASEGPHVSARLSDEMSGSDESLLQRDITLEDGARAGAAYGKSPEIEMTVDALHVEKALHASFDTVRTKAGEPAVAVVAWWNYPAWVTAAEVRLFKSGDTVRGTPVSVTPLAEGAALVDLPNSKSGYKVLVRVYDKDGHFDETAPRQIDADVTYEEEEAQEGHDLNMNAYGANSIAVSNIRVDGATVRVFGRNLSGETATTLGQTVFLDAEGQFVTEAILPDGLQLVEVAAGGRRVIREVDVKTRDIFATGLVEATIGQRLTVRPGDDETYIDGRAAFYVRGRLNSRYRITATADTGEAAIEDLFDNLDDQDARNLLRRLDPDRYYPVYGDDSTITEDAPTSGRFYLRVERDDDYALWGNYQTGFNVTEFTRIERTLYGAKLKWDQDSNPTTLGDVRSTITAFVAEPGTRSGRDELRGTGGSVYYLRNADLSIGSEIVRIETRDVVSGIVISSRPMLYGQDYDIDYIQGRILLNAPLASTSDDGRLFQDGGLSGNAVFLVAEYEYTADFGDSDEVAFGLRGSRWINDAFKGGLTWTRDAQSGETTDLIGADVTWQIAGGTFLKAEIAGSDGSGFDTFRSLDGGFDYVKQTAATGATDPMAWLVEGAADFADLGLTRDGKVSAYARHRDAGFAGYGQLAEDDIDQFGAMIEAGLTDMMSVRGRVDVVEGGFGGERKLAELALTIQATNNVSVQTGVSYQDDREFEDSLAVGARVDYQASEDKKVYVFGQVGVDGDGNADLTDRVGVGAEAELNEKLALGGELSVGAGGFGAKASVRHQNDEFSETYLSYDLPTRSNVGERNGAFGQQSGGLTVGAKRRYTDAVSVYGEERMQFGSGEFGQSGVTHAYGVDYKPATDWTLGLQVETGQINDFDRNALSVTAGYSGDQISSGATMEYRTDENQNGGENLEAVLFRGTSQFIANEELRLQAKLNHANTTGSGGAGGAISFNQANFTEASVAGAYRPIDNDRLNLLAKAVYLSDTSPADQRINGNRIDYKQRSVILSLDATYDLIERCSAGGKIGHRSGEVTDGRNQDDFFESEATLYVARIDCHVVKQWDMMLEGRRLELGNVPGRDGGLVGIFRHIGTNVRIGGGIAWGGVDDEYLSLNEEKEAGPFINIITKF